MVDGATDRRSEAAWSTVPLTVGVGLRGAKGFVDRM